MLPLTLCNPSFCFFLQDTANIVDDSELLVLYEEEELKLKKRKAFERDLHLFSTLITSVNDKCSNLK